ncbi:MAG: FHA domain-containing protein [Proteobacteria bacterium]|nr:FHA domain-containing protein [Pseudomonadota bacterium]
MDEEKRFRTLSQGLKENKTEGENMNKNANSSRARNRTVMLNADMTGQVRSLLNKDGSDDSKRDALNQVFSNDQWNRPDQGKKEESHEAIAQVEEHVEEEADRVQPTGKIHTSFVNQVLNHQADTVQAVSSVGGIAKPASPVIKRDEPKKATPTSKIIGFFVTFDNSEFGEVYEIRAGRWLITSKPTDHGEYILINHPTISPLHAVVRAAKDGKIQILDQLSEFGTGIVKAGTDEEIDIAGSMIEVAHGDIVRFGERKFVVCSVPVIE